MESIDGNQLVGKYCPDAQRLCDAENAPADAALCIESCPRPGGIEVERHRLSPMRLLGEDTVLVCSVGVMGNGETDTLQTS